MGKGKRLRAQRAAEETQPCSYPPTARSFELKMWRASEHLQDLKTEVDAWIEAALQTVEEEPDPEGSGYYAAWVTPPIPDRARVSLLTGDCLQCMRSALDHVAFELASPFTVPMTNEIEQDSEFPIVSDLDWHRQPAPGPRKWRDGARMKVRGADPLAQAEIERLQSYHRGNQFDADPLWRLGSLNNIDKHRALHVVGAATNGATMPVNGPNLPDPNGRRMSPLWDSPMALRSLSKSRTRSRRKAAQK